MKFARMQHLYQCRRAIFPGPKLLLFAACFSVFVGAGCGERPTTIDPPPIRPHAGATLTVAASDAADGELLRRLARSWSIRSGAKVQVSDDPWDGKADVGLIRPAELARWAEPGQLLDVPAALKDPTHPYMWDDLLPVYSTRLLTWGERTVALPVIGEGIVLAYRRDAFDGKDGRPLDPPGTWEELLEAARALGPRSLPPVPADLERLGVEFLAAAASYDRQAVGRLTSVDVVREEFFAFQFDPKTGAPRLEAPAFRHVAGLFHQLNAFRASAPDAAAAFQSGQAKVGLLSLAELGRVGLEVAQQLGVAPIPGARVIFDADGTPRPTGQGAVNRVPYLGWGGRVGVVSAKCSAPEAAWDFLADVGLPDRTALELLADPRIGAGPYRTSQLDTRARPRWFGYGLPAGQVDRLTNALRDNLGPGVQNYRLRLRTPNQHVLIAAFDEDLRSFLKAPKADPAAALARANRRWAEIIAKEPPAQWRTQARRSLGF
jgi:ABC-type glycerol-3-phosphate transport system substrate-binding protein